VIAIAVDWLLATAISVAFFSPGGWSDSNAFATLAVFAVAQIVFLVILNGSVGHLLLGLRLVPIERGYLGVWRPIVRTVLLCAVIPAVIFNTDQRGLHDLAVGTVLVRR